MNGTGYALGIERNPEIDLEFQHSVISSIRMRLGRGLILSSTKDHNSS